MTTSNNPDTGVPSDDAEQEKEPAETGATGEETLAEGHEDDEELLRIAKERYRVGIDATQKWREDALVDLEFLAGEQWDEEVRAQRDIDGRPALTVNRLPQFVQQVTNEQRQSKPSITVNPIDSESDKRTAEVLQGVIRNIEYTSNASEAYAEGGTSAARTGLGYWDVACEYESEKSFEQKLTIRRIKNPLSVVMDPGAKELAGDDARWVIISTDMSRAEWESSFPGREMPRGAELSGPGDSGAEWVAKDGVRIHEYRYVSEEPDELIDISGLDDIHKAAMKEAGVDPSSGAVLASEVGDMHAATLKGMKLPTRHTMRRKACYAKFAGDEVLERGDLNGRYLQLVRVVGTELEINGVTIYEGVVRHAKDTQRMLNYYVSAEAEAIALAPKAPFIAAEGQTEDYEAMWESANKKPHSRLIYKPVALGGQALPAPERVMAEANVQAISQARMMAGDDLKAVTGIYDASLGAKSNEQSGRAILARQNQGNTTNFHFSDNLAAAIRYTGRILIDLIPKVYAGPRVLRILGDDEVAEMVPVNGAPGGFRGEDGAVIELDAGRYDVAVSMGPSYLSRRQEAAAQTVELLKVNPQVAPAIMDIIVRNMDIPGGDEIADRLKKLLPPQIRPPDDKQPPAQLLAQQVHESQAMIAKLTQQLHAAMNQLESKAEDNAAKERIALIQAWTQVSTTLAKLKSDEALTQLERETDIITTRLKLDGITQPPVGAQGEAPNGSGNPGGAVPGDAGPGLPAAG